MRKALLLVGLLLLADEPQGTGPPSITAEERKTFDSERVVAGKDPDKLIKLALWAESKGLKAERASLLKDAAAADPRREAAWGLLGLMPLDGRFKSPEDAAKEIQAEEARALKMVEYVDRRDQLNRAEQAERDLVFQFEQQGQIAQAREVQARINHKLAPAHLRLGSWCESNGMKPEAIAHFTSAVMFDPYLEQGWKHLGYIKHDGRWMNHDQIVAEQKAVTAQRAADRHWGPLLARWKTWLTQPSERARALEELDKINDPLALPAIVKTFLTANKLDQEEAIELLGRIKTPVSSREIAMVAVRTEFGSVSTAALKVLKERDPREFAEMLVKSIHTPWTYKVTPVQGPGSKGELVIDTPRFRLIREYDAPLPFKLGSSFRGYVGIDSNGLPVVMSGFELDHLKSDLKDPKRRGQAAADLAGAEQKTVDLVASAQFKAEASRQMMISDINEIDANNDYGLVLNERIRSILEETMDAPKNLGDDEDAWNSWYYDKIGYRYTPSPKLTYRQSFPQLQTPRITSCFASGTPVQTLGGRRPIESLSVGDQVLSQDVNTGSLGFQPILVVHHNRPDQTVDVSLDNGDQLVASRFHRFWLAGRGWVMARDLKVGDPLRTLGGLSRVRAVAEGPVVPVFNLDVAGGRTFFVGEHDALVHDNTMPSKIEFPFDAKAEIPVKAASKP